MTKERRLAIEMWTEIAKAVGEYDFDIYYFKRNFTEKHKLNWQSSCWFCQYVRNDYRTNLQSRSCIDQKHEGCYRCPLFKNSYETLHRDECGCDCNRDTIFWRVAYGNREHRKEAAWKIVELLGGEVPAQYRRTNNE